MLFKLKSKIISPDLQHRLDFLWAMTEKEIKARYKHAVLGFLWMFLNPVLQMMVIGLVFQFFVPVEVDNYFLFLLSGLLPWNFFSSSLSKTTPIYVYERGLIQKAIFPREAIALSVVASNFFHLLASLCLLLPIVVINGGINLVNLLLLPLPLLWLLILTSGLSLLFSSLNVRFRDVNFAVQALMPLWFYATPVVYDLSLLPQSLHWLFSFNPLTMLNKLFRYSLLGLSLNLETHSFIGVLISLILVLMGIIIFRQQASTFDDWV